MTGSEMVYSFQQLLETMSHKFTLKDRLDTYEILDFINKAVDRYIKSRYFSGESFKQNTLRLGTVIDDLRELVAMSDITDAAQDFFPVGGMNGAYVSKLPDDFLGYVSSSSKLSRTNVLPATNAWVPNTEIDYVDVPQFLTTPFNIPIIEKPLVFLKNNDILEPAGIIVQNFITIVDVHTTLEDNMIVYIKKPTKIDMSGKDCQLSDYLHEEIVKLAVSIYFDEYKSKLIQKA